MRQADDYVGISVLSVNWLKARMGKLWPTACLYLTCELRIDFKWLKKYRKKRTLISNS